MNKRFTTIYRKENISDIETQLLDKHLQTDFTDCKITHKDDDLPFPNIALEEVLEVFIDNEKKALFIFFKYSLGEYLGIGSIYMPEKNRRNTLDY